MPKKKLKVSTNTNIGPAEKSLSNPDIREVGNKLFRSNTDTELEDCRDNEHLRRTESQKRRKGSWFSRLLRPLGLGRLGRRRTTEPFLNVSIPQLQKSPSSQFYTPPPQKFLDEVTSRCDDVDDVAQYSNRDKDLIKKDPSCGKPALLTETCDNADVSKQVKSNIEGLKKEDSPKYDNCLKMKFPASTRRQSRPRSRDSASESCLSDFQGFYEETWKVLCRTRDVSNPSFRRSEASGASSVTDLEPQPIKPLLEFPKPKLPLRKPSSRRGSRSEVVIRRRSSEASSTLEKRRSKAELDKVLQRLSDIPAPDIDTLPPTPKPMKRTKFFITPPRSPDNTPTGQKSDVKQSTQSLFTKDNTNEVGKKETICSKEPGEEMKTDKTTSLMKRPLTRTGSFPEMKLPFIINEIEASSDNSPTGDTDQSRKCKNSKYVPLKRWKTMPTRYYLNSGEYVLRYAESKTILVWPLKNPILKIDRFEINSPHIAVLLSSQNHPFTQNNYTQTGAVNATSLSEEETSRDSQFADDVDRETQKEAVQVNQHTPPNTPESHPESDFSSLLGNNYSKDVLEHMTHPDKVGCSNAIHTITSNECHTYSGKRKAETCKKDTSSKVLSNLNEFQEKNVRGETFVSSETLSNLRGETFVSSKTLSKVKGETFVSSDTLSNVRGETFVSSDTLSNVKGETFVSSDTLSNVRAKLKNVSKENLQHRSKWQTAAARQEVIKSRSYSNISFHQVTSEAEGNRPIKPQRILRKPPTTPKPALFPKAHDFVRQGALRQKRNSSSHDPPNSPTRTEYVEATLNHSESSLSTHQGRSKSLFPVIQNTDETKDQNYLMSRQRSKSIY